MTVLTWVIFVVAVGVVVLLVTVAAHRRRENELRQRFRLEDPRAAHREDVAQVDGGTPVQARAADPARRRDELTVTDLDPASRARFDGEWLAVQSRFDEEAERAVVDADGLVTAVMRRRGYPVEDFEARAWTLAADHVDVVEHYRQARAAHTRHLRSGRVGRDDLRQAFMQYRMLYAVLSGRSSDHPLTLEGAGFAVAPDGLEARDVAEGPGVSEPRGVSGS